MEWSGGDFSATSASLLIDASSSSLPTEFTWTGGGNQGIIIDWSDKVSYL